MLNIRDGVFDQDSETSPLSPNDTVIPEVRTAHDGM